jgi:hypothetical protein
MEAVTSANGYIIVIALGVYLLQNVLKALRWRLLLEPAGKSLPFLNILMNLFSAQSLNSLYPARVGDLNRVLVIGGRGPGRTFTLGTVVVEKLVDALFYALLLSIAILFIKLPEWMGGSAVTMIFVTIIAACTLVVLAAHPDLATRIADRVIKYFPSPLRSATAGRLNSLLASLDILRARGGVIKLALWTAAIWTTALLINQLVFLAMDLDLPWQAGLLLLLVLQAGISMPSVPGRIGLFEYLCVLTLSLFGVSQEQALSYGIVLHALVFLPTIFLGVLALLGVGMRPERNDFESR